MDRRAVTPVIGLALLVGLVAIGSIGLLVLSTALTDDTRTSIDHQQAEHSLGEFAATADEIAEGEREEGAYEVHGAARGTIRSMPYDGDEISITVLDGNETPIFSLDRTMGSVVYDTADGHQLAYQGGGVWRLDRTGRATMVEPPEFQYRHGPEPTLTFPLTLVRDDFSATGEASGTLRAGETVKHYPDEPNHYNPLVNGSVVLDIDSLYCDGWERYIEERTDGTVTERCDARGATDESEVRVTLSVPFTLDGLERGAVFNGGVDGDHIDGNYTDGGHSMASPTQMIQTKVEACREGDGTDITHGGGTDDPGLYCVDSDAASGGQDYTVDATSGDVEIAVDGPIPYDELDVVGSGNVSLYVDGDLFDSPGGGSATLGNATDPSQLRIYVSSNNEIRANALDVYGLLYAPTSDVDGGGQFDVEGGVVADEAQFRGNSEIRIDESVLDVATTFQPDDADLYFLHITETELVFEED